MSYTIRSNTTARFDGRKTGVRGEVPPLVETVRLDGRPKIIDADSAEEIATWINQNGWEIHEAPVFLEPLG